MASIIDILISRIKEPELRAELAAAMKEVGRARDFGLVFESHLPEIVRLTDHPVRRGAKVVLRDAADATVFEVLTANGICATIRPLRTKDSPISPHVGAVTITKRLEELIVVAEFGDPIFPGLRQLGSISLGEKKPSHIVIQAENLHSLEALQFSHAGRVDCIYIDPPYNTGARDWKYNNNYVDSDDKYRHSKWLAFMQRRLRLAKELLNPKDSVLIITIDEKEFLRLGLLLEQTFPQANIQMISTLVNPAGVARPGQFARVDEYIFFVMIGNAAPQRLRLRREWVSAKGRTHTGNLRWDLLRRSGPSSKRIDSPNCFYPIYIDPSGPEVAKVGAALPPGISQAPSLRGCVAVLPIRKDGSEGRWQWTPKTFRERLAQGRVRITGSVTKGFVVSVLKDGEYSKVTRGEFQITGHGPDGSIVVDDIEAGDVIAVPGSQWRISSHDATQYGTRMLADSLVPGGNFPFPKSLYAVEDALRFFVQEKPDAVVLDFFAGSGTTAHAVARLNHRDGGQRQSISITNNEVSEAEAKSLRAEGYGPGDPAWEARGIFEYVTRPRITAAVTGRMPDGSDVKGDYKFNEEFPISDGLKENVAFFELTYEDAARVELDLEFDAIAALLWMRAGGVGPIITACLDGAGRRKPYAWTDHYAVLFNSDCWRTLIRRMPKSVETVFVVTDSITDFSHIVAELPATVRDTVRLYERYMTTFAINQQLDS